MQLNEEEIGDLNIMVKTKGYAKLLEMVELIIDTHVSDVDTVEELYFAKGQNELFEFLANLEETLERLNDL